MTSFDSGYGVVLLGAAIGALIGAATGLFAVVVPGQRFEEVYARGIAGAVVGGGLLFLAASL